MNITDVANNKTTPILIVVRGLPGSGKSYLATVLEESIGKDSVVALDPDATDYTSQAYEDHVKMQTKEGVDPKLHPYRFLRAKAHKGITTNKIIVWNQPFTNLEIFKKMLVNLQGHAADNGTHLPLLVVEVQVNPVTAKQRVADRKKQGGHGPSDNTFERFIREYTSFAPEGYHTVTVNGDDDVAVSVAKVKKVLEGLVPK